MNKFLILLKTKTLKVAVITICIIAGIFLFFYNYGDCRVRDFYIKRFKPYRSTETIESALKYGDKEFLIEILEHNSEMIVLSNKEIYYIFNWQNNLRCRGFGYGTQDLLEIKYNTIEILDYLLEHPNIEWKGKYDYSPLYWMIVNDYKFDYGRQMFDIAKRLLRKDVFIDAVNDEQPLIYLALFLEEKDGDYSYFDLLLANGANINIQNEKGQTSLHIAVENNIEVWKIQKLLESGININLRDNNGWTVLNLAEHTNKKTYVEIITSQ